MWNSVKLGSIDEIGNVSMQLIDWVLFGIDVFKFMKWQFL